MKIRLIQPTQLDENGNPVRYSKLIMPFLTLATLAGLTPEDVDIAITDDYVETVDYDEEVDLVGITSLTSQAPRAYRIADEMRRSGRKTIMGGIHASVFPDEALQHVDSVLIGEAEDLWQTVIADAAAGRLKPLYRADRKPNLSRLAIPRFDLFDADRYLVPPFSEASTVPIQTSRGCPNRCDFCSVSDFLGREIRRKPVANVVQEIESSGSRRIFFTDDNITGNPARATELFEALRPMKLRWTCQMSTQVMSHPKLIRLAARAGCHENFVGIEAVSVKNLRSVHKDFNRPEEYSLFFRMLKDEGIFAQVAIIFGFDEDTVESLKRTIDQVLSWDINYLYIMVLTPLPGTRLYEQMKREDRIANQNWSLYDCIHPVIRFKSISAADLMGCLWSGYGRFYSMRSILKRMWRFRREYIAYFPRDSALDEVFFSLGMRKSIYRKERPNSPGLRKAYGEIGKCAVKTAANGR